MKRAASSALGPADPARPHPAHETPSHDPRKLRRRQRAKQRRRRWVTLLVGSFAVPLIKLLARTWRVEREGELGTGPGQPRMIALWHGRMLLGLASHRVEDAHILVSRSADGSLIASLLERLGFRVVRGSSKRGGGTALRTLLRNLTSGQHVVITPDGPRGPRHSITSAPAWLARATGLPIVPTGFAARPALRLSTWDRFTIPLPWARVAITYGAPLLLEPSDEPDGLARDTDRIRSELLAAEQRSFERLDLKPDW